MPPLYIVEQGAKLRVEQRRLLVEKDGQTVVTVPFAHTNAVVIFGNVSLTTPAMTRLMDAGIDVVFLTYNGEYRGRLLGAMSNHGQLRHDQHRRLQDEAFRLRLGQALVSGKIQTMRAVLMRHEREYPDAQRAASIARLQELGQQVQRTTRLSSLLGVEGRSAAAYFSVFRTLIRTDWPFEGRKRRPPTDPVNVLLSFGYTLLARAVEASVLLVGLDPAIGILHTIEYGRPSLALDLMEEFRAPVVDAVVLRCINTRILTLADFTAQADPTRPIVLNDSGRRAFIRAYEERLETVIRHPLTNEQMTYRRTIEIQTRLLARCLRDGSTDYEPFKVR